ncbi:helix-turn-helix transcriptional regulator [Salinibacterium sp. ZJ77]|uniref:PadR family transcriptional regulator n=1 Tax=Salinibacterium sp. ZJ77 TaxID=2708337 RepID=UPI00141FD3F7|nr:helix-turn-helix transcriptional regulator [Salinibacterium sp. ZJ77]
MEPLSRLTSATADVLSELLSSPDPVWGLQIISRSGRPAGSVYPILERLERAGWVTSAWEDDSQRSGARRRLYRLTADGAVAAREAVARVAAGRSAPGYAAYGRIAGVSA